MRIINVRFKNLNSLVGSWSIDFTDQPIPLMVFCHNRTYRAGKTTILDAICLAYAGIPRA